ncbi:MAG: AAA family ATPase [Streptosporangiaceae bacterium]
MTGNRFTVLTGGPGAGKTSVIGELRRRGHPGTQEAGRAIITDQQLVGGNARHTGDRELFAELMLSWEMRSYRLAEDEPAPAVFFDRGIPELTGYFRLIGRPVPAHMTAAARRFRYRPRVFVAPPWPEIYATDAERGQDFAEAVATCDAVTAAYAELGYELIELPFASVGERADFVLARR